MENINDRINNKALFKLYNPNRPVYNCYSPSYNFGEIIQSIHGWSWNTPTLNGGFNYPCSEYSGFWYINENTIVRKKSKFIN